MNANKDNCLKFVLANVTALAVLVAAGCATSRVPGRSTDNSPIEPLRPGVLAVVLEPSKTNYVLGEPVYVTVRLRNTGAEPFSGAPRLDPELGEIHISIASGETKP